MEERTKTDAEIKEQELDIPDDAWGKKRPGGPDPSRGTAFDSERGGPAYCCCPKCGAKYSQKVGIPCSSVTCIKCGVSLTKW